MTSRDSATAIVLALIVCAVSAFAWETLHNGFPAGWTATVIVFVLAITLPLLIADFPPKE